MAEFSLEARGYERLRRHAPRNYSSITVVKAIDGLIGTTTAIRDRVRTEIISTNTSYQGNSDLNCWVIEGDIFPGYIDSGLLDKGTMVRVADDGVNGRIEIGSAHEITLNEEIEIDLTDRRPDSVTFPSDAYCKAPLSWFLNSSSGKYKPEESIHFKSYSKEIKFEFPDGKTEVVESTGDTPWTNTAETTIKIGMLRPLSRSLGNCPGDEIYVEFSQSGPVVLRYTSQGVLITHAVSPQKARAGGPPK